MPEKLLQTITAMVLQKGLKFFGEIKKQLKLLTTGFHILIWILKEIL